MVEERVAPRGLPVKEQRGSKPRPAAAQRPPSRPTGPVAQPVRDGTTSSRVQVTVAPLGVMRYDAQTLPLVSPNGAFMAVQEGDAPTWDTLLATDQQEPAENVRVVVYTLTDAAPAPAATRAPLPPGVFLGRDADARGFLIESVRPDASRWIGLVHWTTGEVHWLVQAGTIAAHASLVGGGAQALQSGVTYERREQGSSMSELVYRDALGNESVLATPDVSYCYPTPSPDGSVIFACAVTKNSLDLIAVRVVDEAQTREAKKLGSIIATHPLGQYDDGEAAAYQVFAPLQPSTWCSVHASHASTSIPFIHPARSRVAVMNPVGATLTWMPAKTVAATAWASQGGSDAGYFCTGPEDLLFQSAASGASTRVISSPYVARAIHTAPAGSQLLLFGPSKARADELELVRLGVGDPSDRPSPE